MDEHACADIRGEDERRKKEKKIMIFYLYICKFIGLRVHIGVHPVRVAGEGEDRVATNIGNNYLRATLSCRFVDIADNYGSVNLPLRSTFSCPVDRCSRLYFVG